MGQFSVEKLVLPGSALSGNQQPFSMANHQNSTRGATLFDAVNVILYDTSSALDVSAPRIVPKKIVGR